MHIHLLTGVYFTLSCLLWAGAVLLVFVHLSGRRSLDYLLVAFLAVVAGLESLGVGLGLLWSEPFQLARWVLGLSIVQAASILAAGLHVHLAMRYTVVRRQVVIAIGTYLLAAVMEFLVLRGDAMHFALLRTELIRWLGLEFKYSWAPIELWGRLALILVPLAHVLATGMFAKAYWQRRRETFSIFVGSTLLSLGSVHDTLLRLGAMRGLELFPLAFGAFLVSVAVAFVQRYSATRLELVRQVKDLSERTHELRKVRRALRATQNELGRKEHLALIGEMAAVIAHEVRNPLAVISNAVASLRREGLSRHDHDVLLTILDEENTRLNRLVTDLLSYARPINLQRQRVILNELVQRATLLVSNRPEAKVVVDKASVRGQIWGDPNLLRQVFDNLVDNALQATSQRGTISVAIKASQREGVDGYLVAIADDGEGMDTQVRNRAKDPFFTTRPSGTGLGLAIVTRIVEAHGGDVSFESRAGEGTTVLVFLPIGTESVAPPEPRKRTPDSVPPPSVPGDTAMLNKIASR